MKIVIAHLYYDLLNLYGESGNVKALKKYFEKQGIDVTIKFLTVDDDMDFSKCDIVYIGMGTENNQKIALKHLLQFKKSITDYINNNGFLIATGNSIELFGKTILDKDKKKYKALEMFNYSAKEEKFRMVDEAILECPFIDKPIIGFQNQGSVITGYDDYCFKVIKGIGSYPKSKEEGIYYKNFLGTYLIGPLLARNPYLLEYIGRKVIIAKNPDYKLKKVSFNLEKKAYQNYINTYYKDYVKLDT